MPPIRSESPRDQYKAPGQVMEDFQDGAACLINGKPVNMSTLTDISQFLKDQNSKLDQ